MFVLELQASDLYAALGRFLDSARVAGLKLAAVSARESAGQYAICATIATRDARSIEQLARKLRTMVGVAAVAVRQDESRLDLSREAETLLVS
jgi:hypothetical protein